MKIPALAAALLLSIAPFGFAQAEGAHERNVAFLWSILGEQDPTQPATMSDGRVLTLAEAVEDAAARAGELDLAQMASGAVVPGLLPHAGDIWVLEHGQGPCTVDWIVPGVSRTFVPVDPQFWLYAGGFGEIRTTHGYYTLMTSWTLKTSEFRFDTNGFWARGITDAYCFHFSGDHLAFPFVDGWAGFN